MNRYGPTDSMEEVRHGSYVLFEEANERIAELEDVLKVYMDVYKYRGLRGSAKIVHEKISRVLSEGGADD